MAPSKGKPYLNRKNTEAEHNPSSITIRRITQDRYFTLISTKKVKFSTFYNLKAQIRNLF